MYQRWANHLARHSRPSIMRNIICLRVYSLEKKILFDRYEAYIAISLSFNNERDTETHPDAGSRHPNAATLATELPG